MKRTLLTLALVAAAGTAGAQTTVTPPSVKAPSIATLPAPNAEGSAAAQARIEADGYSNVQGLNRGADGKWRGQATRGGARVGIIVDANGTVTTE